MAACVEVMRATLVCLFLSGAATGFILDQQSTNFSASCVDSPNLECAAINRTSNLCANTGLARQLCPMFCGFCSIVDGNWTDWSAWSQCDVTCDNGTQYHTRTCTNPPPSLAQGVLPAGRSCEGATSATQICTNDLCPVHGAWGSWSVWGECSVTCDIGMQRRDRHCDNPYPARNGDHCFGEGAAYRICLPGACADGGWSAWDQWSDCSVACGGGLRSRHRTCDNPVPSPVGRFCQGNPQEVDPCNNQPCNGTFIHEPVAFIAYLTGGDIDPVVGQAIVFNQPLQNYGNAYNSVNGEFTPPVAGVYHLSVQICMSEQDIVAIQIKSSTRIYAASRYQEEYDVTCYSVSTVAVLGRHEKVWVNCIQYTDIKVGNSPAIEADDTSRARTMFNGHLVQPLL